MSETKELTHWKKLQNPNYLGSFSLLKNEEKVLTIKYVAYETVTGSDGRKEECAVMHFAENELPMILNVTNSKAIESIAKTPYIEKWAGQKIQIYIAQVSAFGETVDALRIRPKAPIDQKLTLDPSYSGWDKALQAMKAGETDLEFLKSKYVIPEDAEKILIEAVLNA